MRRTRHLGRSADQPKRRSFQQNHGVPGVVYILTNPALATDYYKIGCSRRSGAIRADEINQEATTGTPAMFQCVFECRTQDCGRAEEEVFAELATYRRGKWGQEFFEVDLTLATATIKRICARLDERVDSERVAARLRKEQSATQIVQTAADQPFEQQFAPRLPRPLPTDEPREATPANFSSSTKPSAAPAEKSGIPWVVILVSIVGIWYVLKPSETPRGLPSSATSYQSQNVAEHGNPFKAQISEEILRPSDQGGEEEVQGLLGANSPHVASEPDAKEIAEVKAPPTEIATPAAQPLESTNSDASSLPSAVDTKELEKVGVLPAAPIAPVLPQPSEISTQELSKAAE